MRYGENPHQAAGFYLTPEKRAGVATATKPIETKIMMRPRAIVEILIVLGIVGLLLEIAEGHTWIVVGAGVAAAVWVLARSH